MILIDYSGISIAAVFGQSQNNEINEDLVRHTILNTLRMYNQKYRDEYGQMILACDSKSWRYKVFPEYKASRKIRRETDKENRGVDWSAVYDILDIVINEIHEHLPYPVLRFKDAEADDIIASMVHGTQDFGKHEPVMIVSSDRDFIQLQKYNNVKQFSPAKKSLIGDSNPEKVLFEHICRGDSCDGVPNILSDDRVFVDGGRQTPLRSKKLDEWYSAHNAGKDLSDVMDSNIYRNYIRNKTIIDLSNIPDELHENIQTHWESYQKKSNNKILNYLISKRCNHLISCVDEFFIKN